MTDFAGTATLEVNAWGSLSTAGPSVPPRAAVSITGYVLTPSGGPVARALVTLKLDRGPQAFGPASISAFSVQTRTDTNGFFTLSAIGGLRVTITIDEAQLRRTGILPFTGTINLERIVAEWE